MEAELYQELFAEAESDLWAWRVWCTRREDSVMLWLAEKADLRRQCEELRETLSTQEGGHRPSSEWDSEADNGSAEEVIRRIDGQPESEGEDEY